MNNEQAGARGRPRVVVVGGGVSGLTAAYRLRTRLGPAAEIVLVERGERLGGKLLTRPVAGRDFDLGAEAFLARRPEVLALAEELDLSDRIVHPGPASATVRAGGALRSLPKGMFMGVPASAEAVREVLSPAGTAAVAAEVHLPPLRPDDADTSVGELLRRRVGDEAVHRLVEPLLGGVYGGSADSLGLRATMPALAERIDAGAGSITDAVSAILPVTGPPEEAKPPVFGSFVGGYRCLLRRLWERAEARLESGLPVRDLWRESDGWWVGIGSAAAPRSLRADAVVLAVPPPSARKLLAGTVPDASEAFGRVQQASMAVVGLALPRGTELPQASGVLIARGERHVDGTPFTAKAFTFSSVKWPHLRGSAGEPLVRASVGRGDAADLRRDDVELVDGVRSDLAELTGIHVDPVETAPVRWGGGIPQYGVRHTETVGEIEKAVADVPGLAVAGAALHGVGVPACVATAETAAAATVEYLSRH